MKLKKSGVIIDIPVNEAGKYKRLGWKPVPVEEVAPEEASADAEEKAVEKKPAAKKASTKTAAKK